MNTPTPRTDAAEAAMTAYNGSIDRVTADFARQLERDLAARDEELAQAIEARDEYRDAVIRCNREVVREQQRAERAEAELAQANELLRFVERWANHHGVKPCVKPEHALSTIQHHPSILAITRSYADGKIPDTPNPWTDRDSWRAKAEANARDAERYRWLVANAGLVWNEEHDIHADFTFDAAIGRKP